MGGTTPGLVFLGAIRKEAEQSTRKKASKHLSYMTSAPAARLQVPALSSISYEPGCGTVF